MSHFLGYLYRSVVSCLLCEYVVCDRLLSLYLTCRDCWRNFGSLVLKLIKTLNYVHELITFSSPHSNSTEFVALILARGGSKGIPRKNLAPIGGVSLLARAIQTIQKANVFREIWVSTDDDEISYEAMRCELICSLFFK